MLNWGPRRSGRGRYYAFHVEKSLAMQRLTTGCQESEPIGPVDYNIYIWMYGGRKLRIGVSNEI